MERSDELEQLVAAWFEAASRGDASLVDAHVSPSDGTRLIGSDPSELFQGGSAVAAFLRDEAETAGGNVAFSLNDPRRSARGRSAGPRPSSRSRCRTERT